jgi:hypothetical protein
MSSIKSAHERLAKANAALADAKAEVEHASNSLDHVLSEAGWERFRGGFSERLYTRLGSSPVSLDQVLAHELWGAAA